MTVVRQLLVPATSWNWPMTTGAVVSTDGACDSAFESATVSVCALPKPKRTPDDDVEPGTTTNRLLPIDAMLALTLLCAPWPTPSISTTAPTPMIIPSIV